MTADQFYKLLLQDFPHKVTSQQDIALQKIANFALNPKKDQLFLLKGYAGTGKTTIIGTLVKNLWKVKMSPVLAAPTGRAAKVMTNYSGYQAHTIHKKIYYPKKGSASKVEFVLQRNKHKDTIFIIDEASMISDHSQNSKLFENGSLLDDLIEYVYSGRNCKLMFIGDTAQLPPVKLAISPALEADKLSLSFQKDVDQIELTEVVRQNLESGILENATKLREVLADEFYESFKFNKNVGGDFERLVDGYEIMDAINDAYSNLGHEETAIIVQSNKRANIYNQQIRSRILFRESEISAGDYLMVVKNNYFWIKPNSEAGFIANGDILEILEIFAIKELYGFRFAEVNVQMVDYPKMKAFETVILLDTLDINAPALPYEDSNKLYQEVNKDYADETSKYKRFMKVKNNPFFNALQVKFSYAITCHKSQGGQWNTVFVEQPYLRDGITQEYLRWLYTACTRAQEKLYLIGFKDDFFVENS
ncbi:ATP-dependent DNA helicase [Haloflavibacter putidus]|uniref:AAA family ATPase n=1 Tax=Haloflavibacter putidus TaxID=2576776 RepID=A0A507ZU04_9FLAO|nr:AAA family ATPase [Haloflavibacter putidus]TQD40071.1 AAA family ATPase [Haloflavibacter putidus]